MGFYDELLCKPSLVARLDSLDMNVEIGYALVDAASISASIGLLISGSRI